MSERQCGKVYKIHLVRQKAGSLPDFANDPRATLPKLTRFNTIKIPKHPFSSSILILKFRTFNFVYWNRKSGR